MPRVYHGDPTIYADLIPAQRVLRAFLLGITASLPVELLSVRPQYRWTVKRRLRILAHVEAQSLRAASCGRTKKPAGGECPEHEGFLLIGTEMRKSPERNARFGGCVDERARHVQPKRSN